MPAEHTALLVDANLVMWAHHRQFPHHRPALAWWNQVLSTVPQIGIPWPTVTAFLRLSTHPRVLTEPITLDDAAGVVARWLGRPNVTTPVPTSRHWPLFATLLATGAATANHVNDAHLAALAMEWGLELASADRDFARYPGLRWVDPSDSW